MKLFKTLLAAVLSLCLLSGCGTEPAPTTPPTIETVASTEAPTDAPTEPPVVTVEAEFSIPGVSVEDMITYFTEVCLAAEYINSGNPHKLQRWEETIYYSIEGQPTEEDIEVIETFAQWLNTIEGFPGMEPSPEPYRTNLNIYFCKKSEMVKRMGDNFVNSDGGVTFWYQEDQIFDAIICIRTDLEQELRNSVILEELYNGLGPIQDTILRSDSINWYAYSEPQSLTQVDEMILRLLYHPSLSCGMDTAECEEAIRQLYH